MKCEETIRKIYERSADTALKAHLLKCERCAAEARLFETLSAIPRDRKEVPEALTIRIKVSAREKTAIRKGWRVFFKVSAGFAAAAAITAISVVSVLDFHSGKTPQGTSVAKTNPELNWESVALSEGLLQLSDEIESNVSAISTKKLDRTPLKTDLDFQVLNLDVPDLLT